MDSEGTIRRAQYPTLLMTRSGSERIYKRVGCRVEKSLSTTLSNHEGAMTRSRLRSPRRNSSPPHSSRNVSRDRIDKEGTKNKPLPPEPTLVRIQRKMKASSIVMANTVAASPADQAPITVIDSVRLSALDEEPHLLMAQKKDRSIVSKQMPGDMDLLDTNRGIDSEGRVFRDSLASAEYDRMRMEIDNLKEALREAKIKYTKKFNDMKAELNASTSKVKVYEQELVIMKDKCRQKDELLSMIETSLQCQICMELLDNPYSLAPCGHVLCLLCLQEWFKKAPPGLDDVNIDPDELGDPQYILTRSKSCPTCRAVIRRRPAPVFMVKTVASALKKLRPSDFLPVPSSEPNPQQDDPWEGIFPTDENSSGDDSDDMDEDDLRYDDDDDRRFQTWGMAIDPGFLITDSEAEDSDADDGSSSDNDGSSGHEATVRVYGEPSWSPPSLEIDPDDYGLTENSEKFKLLRRGCSYEMICTYNISYSHQAGIIVYLQSLNRPNPHTDVSRTSTSVNRVFLGFNVDLAEDDRDGTDYLTSILEDIKRFPAQWKVVPRAGGRGTVDATRLVDVDDILDHDTTDSEGFVDAEG